MRFFAVNGERPIRSSISTRQFAFDSLNHKYGKQIMDTPHVVMDDVAGYEQMNWLERYDAAIEKIVREAPIRICEDEKLSGSATLGDATRHVVPAFFRGEQICSSISHLTIDFETVLKIGVDGIEKNALAALEVHRGTEREPFLRSCLHVIACMRLWRDRYLEALRDHAEYAANYQNLQKVPFAPAENFYEAVQSLWFTFAFVRLCGNWPGFGRIDWLLGDYLKQDLANGVLTLEEAREILAHFFIKGCEWIRGGLYGSGDAQHYQNIVLAGIDENGEEVTNEVTYLVLDIIEEFGISDFPTTVRVNKNTDEKLLSRVAEVLRYGGGVLAVYNEELIIEAMTDYGYPLEHARQFANDGCWEMQVPGKTYFIYQAIDALHLLQTKTLQNYAPSVDYDSFEQVLVQYIRDLDERVKELGADQRCAFVNTAIPTKDWHWKPTMPCTVVSIFEQGCIEKGCSYLEGGPIYNVVAAHIGGLPDVVNDLYAIKKLVFDDKLMSFTELMAALANNWEGCEALRRHALTKYTYFGNDNDEVDALAVRLFEAYADSCDNLKGYTGYMTPAGVSTFGRQIEWAPHRRATASGRKANEVLSGNFSPTPGTDKEGATAIIKSYCKVNLKRAVSGAALDIKLLPSAVNHKNGIQTLTALMRGFVALGGCFMQPDIADAALLKAAQEHPEEYQNLSVRVSGWNARFVTLDKSWQDMVIAQTGNTF